MSLKDKDEFAVLVESAIENNSIGRIVEDYSKMSLELKSQEEKISSQEVLKRKLILEGEVKRLKAMIDGTDSHKKETEDRYRKMQASLEQKAKEMEGLLQEIIGEKVSLDVS
jgi:peptidoglycan hydrolase CwlO-like protein